VGWGGGVLARRTCEGLAVREKIEFLFLQFAAFAACPPRSSASGPLGACRSLPAEIAETAQAVEDFMTADFLDRTRFGGMDAVQRLVLERLAAQVALAEGGSRGGGEAATVADGEIGCASAAAATPLADVEGLDRVVRWVEVSSGIEGDGGDRSAGSSGVSRQETSDALVPLVLGLRRIQQLPAALRSMQDAACAHLRDAIRCAGGRGREGGASRLRFPCAPGTGPRCCVLCPAAAHSRVLWSHI
jgi:hypothetical protein